MRYICKQKKKKRALLRHSSSHFALRPPPLDCYIVFSGKCILFRFMSIFSFGLSKCRFLANRNKYAHTHTHTTHKLKPKAKKKMTFNLLNIDYRGQVYVYRDVYVLEKLHFQCFENGYPPHLSSIFVSIRHCRKNFFVIL